MASLTDIAFFAELDMSMRAVTEEDLAEINFETSVPESAVSLGPMSEALKALLYISQAAYKKVSEEFLKFARAGIDLSDEEIFTQANKVAMMKSSAHEIEKLFWASLAHEYGFEVGEQTMGFGPDFEVYIEV